LRRTVHRIVAETYLPNPFNFSDVNHLDGDKLNNKVSNLEWCSRSANQIHSRDIGTSGVCKLSMFDAIEIRDLFKSGKYTKTKLSDMYNVHWYTIHSIIIYKTWSTCFDGK
jgi:hypothetical protein